MYVDKYQASVCDGHLNTGEAAQPKTEWTRKQEAMLLWPALLWEAGGGILFPCICAFLLHIFCRICKSAQSRGLQQGPDSHPALEAGMVGAEFAHTAALHLKHCHLAVVPWAIADLLKHKHIQHENPWNSGQPKRAGISASWLRWACSCFYWEEMISKSFNECWIITQGWLWLPC